MGNLFSGNLEKITACVFRNIAVMHLAVILEFWKLSRNALSRNLIFFQNQPVIT